MNTEQAEDRFIEALDAFEAGDYRWARELLQPLRERPAGDEVREATDGLLRRMAVDPGQLVWAGVVLLGLLGTIIGTTVLA